jgi:glyoxylate reductase
LITLKKRILVSVGRVNFPEDVAETLSPLTEIIYPSSRDYSDLLADVEAVIVGTELIDEDYLRKAPKLKLVSRFGVGYDSVNIEACTKRGVYITYTPGVLSEAVAEHAWALILSFMKKIVQGNQFAREEWSMRKRVLPLGSNLKGKTIGIIGLGAIGAEVAKRAQGFEVKVLYHDVVRRPKLEREYGVEFIDFEGLLRVSDIITLHVPLFPTTRGLIGCKELDMMKPTAILVNTSRGPVVDQSALVEAIEEGKIAGAALDVFEAEPIPLDDKLLDMENVLLTPHIASATVEARRMMALSCAESVQEFLESKIPTKLILEQKGVFS